MIHLSQNLPKTVIHLSMPKHSGFGKFKDKWLELPVTFWDSEGGSWSRDNYGVDHKKIRELVKITKYNRGGKGKQPSLNFKYSDGDTYTLGTARALQYLALKYFHGMLFQSPLLCVIYLMCCV